MKVWIKRIFLRLTLGKDLETHLQRLYQHSSKRKSEINKSIFGVFIYLVCLYLTVDFNHGRIFQFFPPPLPLTFNARACVGVYMRATLKERGNYTVIDSQPANWRCTSGETVSTVDISAAMFSFGLINSRIRPQFARLGLLIFVQLIIKSAPN